MHSGVVKLNQLSPMPGSRKERKRVGRGPGSTTGKTAGYGHNGQKKRSGGVPANMCGGQTPIYRLLPKYGFVARPTFTEHVTIDRLVQVAECHSYTGSINIDLLKTWGLITKKCKRSRIVGSRGPEKVIVPKGISVSPDIYLTERAKGFFSKAQD